MFFAATDYIIFNSDSTCIKLKRNTYTITIYKFNYLFMDFNNEIKNRLLIIQNWLDDNKIGATKEKRENIAWDMFRYVVKHEIVNDIHLIKNKLKLTPFSIQSGNLWEHLLEYFDNNAKFVAFFKDICELTPSGLNTSPNACCGKFELFYRLVRPNSTQPTKGDIMDNGIIYELKGSQVRISDTELTGIEYKKNCSKIFEGHIVGNIVKSGGLIGSNVYEIEKTQHKSHYQTQFAKDLTLSKQLLREYFSRNGWICTEEDIHNIFHNDVWNQDIMQQILLRNMFIKYKQKKEFDTMFIFGNGTNIKIIRDPEDLNKIQITTDYFRINQTGNVGWYIE